jgi:hypothetical protein
LVEDENLLILKAFNITRFFFTFRNISMFERIYCWFLIIVGIIGGTSATITAIKNIVQGASFDAPCYVQPFL